MMIKPGYKTSEHAITWAVILLGAAALYRGGNALEQLASLLAPAIASAAYSQSRAKAKTPFPFADRQLIRDSLREQLSEAFRGRVVK